MLTRGYSIVRTPDGHIVRTSTSLHPDDILAVPNIVRGIETGGRSRFPRVHGRDPPQGYLYGRLEPVAILAARWRIADSGL